MRIAIFGTGGTGGYFGAHLARAGEDVIFIAQGYCRWQAFRTRGLGWGSSSPGSGSRRDYTGPRAYLSQSIAAGAAGARQSPVPCLTETVLTSYLLRYESQCDLPSRILSEK